MEAVATISQWLLSEGRKTKRLSDLLSGFCSRLREGGIPVDRATLGAPLLHPIAQSSYASWSADEEAEDHWFIWNDDNLNELANSPIHDIYVNNRGRRLMLFDASDRDRFGIGRTLAEQGFQEYAALVLPFSDGTSKAFTAAIRQPGGFTDKQYDDLASLALPLSAVLETLVLRRTAATLLDTYVGKRSGRQVLDGRISRGDGEHIEAVIWMSDLRGFTGLSTQMDEASLLRHLNVYFETVTDAIDSQGGETLKFIGDAILAIFPHGTDPRDAAARAEAAASQAMKATSRDNWPRALKFGIALHTGEVFFGNVGGRERLDFTVIGQAVNLVSRIEALCGKLDAPVLVSGDFVRIASNRYASAGRHSLKGLTGEQEIFTPVSP